MSEKMKQAEKQGLEETEGNQKCFSLGVRHIQMASMCGCMIALFIARGSMGVAILAMTDSSRRNDTSVQIYDWDKQTQGVILSSFFWGYMAMQIPAGILAKRFGGKPILLVALLTSGVVCLLMPVLAHVGGWRLVCGSRVVMGLTQACLFPASHTLLGRWLPAHERTSLSGLVYGGSHLGTIIAMPLAGYLSASHMGWKLIFYSVSGLMFLTAAVWFAFAASTPAEHRMMSVQERWYIEKELATQVSQGVPRTPWRRIFTTRQLWALVVAHIGSASGYTLFFVDLPTYLERGLQISLKDSASLSALPYVGMFIGSVFSTYMCEMIYNRGYLSITTCRKLFNSIGFFGTAIGLLGLGFLGPDQKILAIFTLVASLTIVGFTSAGFMMNHLDLSPNYAGVMLSITNFSANFGSISMPIITGVVLQNDPTDVTRWRIVFMLTAALYLLSNTIYLVFADSERQEWDDPDYIDKKNVDPEEMKSLKKDGESKVPT